jgi:iron complex outermembrane receptor protein
MKRNLLMSTALPGMLAGVFATPALAQASAPSPAAAAAADGPDGRGITDIVVTATRRSEKLQNVAVSVMALGADQLQQKGITNLSQLLTELPQVHIGGRGPGQNSVSIRGLSLAQIGLQGSALAGPDPTVAIYLDDASVAMPGRNLDIYVTDLERVEVLEGPQGTLFGASAEGGAIRYITAKPNLTKFKAGFALNGAATPGHEFSTAVNGYVNIPIIADKLAVRATLFVDRQGGYIDNVPGSFQMPLVGYNADGTVAYCLPGAPVSSCGSAANAALPPAPRPVINNAAYAKKDFNPATYAGGRISAKWQVSPDWSVSVQDMYQSLEAEGVFQFDPTLGDLKIKRFSPDSNHDKFNQVQWGVEGKLAGLKLVYAGSYLNRKIEQKLDYTQYASVGPFVPYYICAYPGYASCATPRMTYLDHSKNTRFTQEFRVSTPDDKRIRLQAGVYYDKTKVIADNVFYYEGAAVQGFNGQIPGGTVKINPYVRPAGGVYFNDAIRGEGQTALFGEASIDITSRLTLTAGARYYNQETSLTGSVNCGVLGAPTLPNGHTCGSGNYAVSLAGKSPTHEKGVTPKVTLSFKPAKDLLLYATYSQGYRPGGFNRRGGPSKTAFVIPFTYKSDKVTNYEFGWKTQFAHNSIRWNGSAYLINWARIPVGVYAPSISNSTFILNGPSARIEGVTSDVVWRATHELTLTGNLAYNHSKLTSYGSTPADFQFHPTDGPRALTFVALGSPLSLAPKWQGGLRARYEHENASATTMFAQAGMQFSSSSFTSTIKTANFKLAGYTQFDASVGVKRDSWTAELYATNLTDKRVETYRSIDDNIQLNSTNRPRTIGLRFNWNY